MKTRLAIFASGFGSNARAIMRACSNNEINAATVLLFTDNPEAHVLHYAREFGVPALSLQRERFATKIAFETAIRNALQQHDVGFVALAGYMRLIGKTLLDAYKDRMINIHPSLLPRYPGLDPIGQAIKNGEREIGVTIHYVDEGIDTGAIIAQQKIGENIQGKEKAEIEKLVHEAEHELYVRVLRQLFNPRHRESLM